MSAEEVTPDNQAEPPLPAALQRVSRNAQPVARALWELPAKDRANLFKAFNKAPPAEGTATRIDRAGGQMIRAEMNVWEGPLPSPEHLARYNEVSPGLADKIVAMAHDQQVHRFGLENRTVDGQLSQSKRGQWFALLLGLTAIAAATYLGMTDHPVVAGIIAGPTIIGFAATFIVGKYQERTSRQNKIQPPPNKPSGR
jgi:uncharacterized membrane protein